MDVELLWWDGCPSHDEALSELRRVLGEEGLDASDVTVREVPTEADAERESFIGSPTIRIDGREVAPEPGEPAGLTCRVYHRRDGRVSPTPDPEDIRTVIKEAIR
jgi:hypothetical protein